MLADMLLLLILSTSGQPDEMPPAAPSPCGLTGTQLFPTTDFLPGDAFRAGVSGLITRPEAGGTAVLLPLSACYGISDGLEVAAALPVYLSDDAWGFSEPAGDLVLSAKYLYESVRGGTSLAFTGRLGLPSGRTPRDHGAELGAGLVTSTTYRLFRLSVSGEYVLSGGDYPLDSRIRDLARFSCGFSSFLSWELEATAVVSAATDGALEAGAGLLFLPLDELVLHASASTGLDDLHGISGSAGAAFTFYTAPPYAGD